MDELDAELQYDCLIIGAGLYGIAAANAYLSLHPDHRLIVLESRSCIGGVWSHERVYDDFWTQTPINMARFSNFPLQCPPDHETYYDFFTARKVSLYLSEYVDKQIYNRRSIRQRILSDSKVIKVDYSASNGRWQVFRLGRSRPFSSHNLLVAAGLTSQANMPELPGSMAFRGVVIHHVDFGQSSILKDPKMEHIAVLGGAKSAADIVYAAAKAGKKVSWIIRKNGSGPAHLTPAKGVGPYRNSNELLYTRLTAILSPSIWNPQDWLSRLLHGTRIGRRAVDWIWNKFDANSRQEAGFRGQRALDGAKKGFANLEPDTSIFWQNDSSGVNQRPDFWSIIATRVHVYRQDVDRLTGHNIVLQDEEVENVDAIICATGWRPSYENFFDDNLAADLGLPVSKRGRVKNGAEPRWDSADALAEIEIARLFPRLQHPPPHHVKPATHSPFRLYRNMIPTHVEKYTGIVFLGHIAVGNNFRAAEVQALWAVAYLSQLVNLPAQAAMETNVALALAWCRKRYLSKGVLGHWLFYDLVPYTDTLLEDIELTTHKGKGWLGDLWKPCVADDLEGLLGELKRKRIENGNGQLQQRHFKRSAT